jgi:hypothetical protein
MHKTIGCIFLWTEAMCLLCAVMGAFFALLYDLYLFYITGGCILIFFIMFCVDVCYLSQRYPEWRGGYCSMGYISKVQLPDENADHVDYSVYVLPIVSPIPPIPPIPYSPIEGSQRSHGYQEIEGALR